MPRGGDSADLRRLVIVGAGLAGHRAASNLRREGFDGELTVIGGEPHLPYDRPPLSKQVLAGTMTAADCAFDCEGLDVRWRLGQAAVGLDVGRREVTLAGGDTVTYDGLVITTGRGARQWPGATPRRGVHTLRTCDDAAALGADVGEGPVVIVGAGFIGCEAASTLRGLGVEPVTLVDIAPSPLAGLGTEVGERARALHERHGVRMRLGASVERFEGEDRVTGVRLATGDLLPARTVLVALGSVPSTRWLERSGLAVARGSLVCDPHCFVLGRGDIVAAGDVAAYPYVGAPTPLAIEHWATARDLGALAAHNLVAEPEERRRYTGVPSLWSDQYDVKIRSAGLLALADAQTVVEEDVEREALVVEASRGSRLVGVTTFNRNRAMIGYQRRLAGEPAPA